MKRFRDILLGFSLGLFMTGAVIMVIAMRLSDRATPLPQEDAITPAPSATFTFTPSETIPPSTPLPTLTPSQTLRPPPTFEPPTATLPPSPVPSATPSPTFQIDVELQDIHGRESATPSTTPGCQENRDWALRYEVQALETLEQIAGRYNVSVWEMAAANCLADMNVIYVGQQLRVPGDAHPGDMIECVAWQVLTPIDGAHGLDPMGQLTFNWRGPNAPRNLIRVYDADNETVFERVVDLRQNEAINLFTESIGEGHYTWQVFPLDMNFMQIACSESPRWRFFVDASD